MAGVPPRVAPETGAWIRERLLAWYDRTARPLPWRARPGERPDPYRVWLSEIMLQQTTAAHAAPYFARFVAAWPGVGALARAHEAEVMAAWAGLGYYARARNLIAAARIVAAERDGRFPEDEAGLAALPGIGRYTAAAIAAIAFDRSANVVDANVERVIARLFAVETPLPRGKGELGALAEALVADDRPGDWAQALMDLGALVCRPRAPDCPACPVADLCAAAASGDPAAWPRRMAKRERPLRHGVAFVLTSGGAVALTRRPPRGLLGGMLGLPTTAWRERPCAQAEAREAAPARLDWEAAGAVRHVFTHFALELAVLRGKTADRSPAWTWRAVEDAAAALPSVFAKALRRGTE